MTTRVGFLSMVCSARIADFAGIEGGSCRDGLGSGATLSMWTPALPPWAPARLAEALIAGFTDVEGDPCLAAVCGGDFQWSPLLTHRGRRFHGLGRLLSHC